MKRLSLTWKQGEHVLISGPTGSGKTMLARFVDEIRIKQGGFVMVMVGKLQRDETIERDYSQKDGWVRWDKMKKNPGSWENKVLLWPKTERIKDVQDKRNYQRGIFHDAFNRLSNVGKWTVHVDEGLYTCAPEFLNLGGDLGMLHAMGRSGKLSIITCVQRPAHVPLIVYSSASHAFVGRAREEADRKRLAELGGRMSAKELMVKLSDQSRHDFTWLPVAPDWEPESVNLMR